ncbi:MAG: hypothetical protein CMJ24_08435 [Phycisphaerae bacterium]|nr:hypothetical protein [Phycisphaerae bacterium]
MANRCSVIALLLAASPVTAQSIVPPPRPPSTVVRDLVKDDFLTDQERMALHRFHGTWDDGDLRTPAHRANAALQFWMLDDPVLQDDDVANLLKARAAALRGDRIEAIRLLEEEAGVPARVLRGRLELEIGDSEAAEASWLESIEQVPASIEDEVARIDAGRRLALLRGNTGDEYQRLMDSLARVRGEVAPLHWPAILLEAELLFEKNRFNDSTAALWEVLELNPRCSEAWYLLGRISVLTFNFDFADQAITALRNLHPQHPLASLLEAEALLTRREPVASLEVLKPVFERYPNLPQARSLELACLVLLDDVSGADRAWARWMRQAPGSPMAATWTGRLLSLHRQYEDSARWLDRAIGIQPNAPLPHVELGLMQWQAGNDSAALVALEEAVELDPFHQRAANSLDLLREIQEYEVVETEHFEIRFSPGTDEALVRDMPRGLESIHEQVAERFGWEPRERTVVEVLPDHERFAVRVVGMPDVHTMAACTGPVIAMEVPRRTMPGRHMGRWDWEHVLQHEYTHTVTLERTRNRIPLWCTEGLAVFMEPAPRDWTTRRMLADEWRNGTLLAPDELNWAFVRPVRPQDRGLAYAQSWLMIENLLERFGEQGLQRLLDQYRDGVPESAAFPAAIGISRERFHEDFIDWAGVRIGEWGLDPEPSMEDIAIQAMEQGEVSRNLFSLRQSSAVREAMRRMLEDVAAPRNTGSKSDVLQPAEWNMPRVEDLHTLDREQVEALLERYPSHPDLLEWIIIDRIRSGDVMDEAAIDDLKTYVGIRPSDPLGHRLLADWFKRSAQDDLAIPHLEVLASVESDDPAPVLELALAFRQAGRADEALATMRRCVAIDPYDPSLRESTAALAIEAGRFTVAKEMIESLMLLEPDQPRHRRRLEAIRLRIEGE